MVQELRAVDAPGSRHAVEFGGGDVVGGEDPRDAEARRRRGHVDRHGFRMGIRRAHKRHLKQSRSDDVPDIAAGTGREAPIFPAAQRHPYQPKDGYHRLYASMATSLDQLPAIIRS
jgi:hypothetical protein